MRTGLWIRPHKAIIEGMTDCLHVQMVTLRISGGLKKADYIISFLSTAIPTFSFFLHSFFLSCLQTAKPLHHHGQECLKLRVNVIANDGEDC